MEALGEGDGTKTLEGDRNNVFAGSVALADCEDWDDRGRLTALFDGRRDTCGVAFKRAVEALVEMWLENVDDEIAGDAADATDVDRWTKMGRLRALRADAARAEPKPEEGVVDNNEGTEDDE